MSENNYIAILIPEHDSCNHNALCMIVGAAIVTATHEWRDVSGFSWLVTNFAKSIVSSFTYVELATLKELTEKAMKECNESERDGFISLWSIINSELKRCKQGETTCPQST